MELLLIKYGALAVFLAAMLDADFVPVLTGAVAHFGYLRVGPAVCAAVAGVFAGDYVWFCAGVYYSQTIRNSRFYKRAGEVPETLSRRLGLWQIPVSHVIYGTRISTMIFCGVQRTASVKFALVDGSCCLVLTGLLFTLGLEFSASASLVVGRVRQVELLLLLGVIAGLLLFFTSRVVVRRLLQEGNSVGASLRGRPR